MNRFCPVASSQTRETGMLQCAPLRRKGRRRAAAAGALLLVLGLISPTACASGGGENTRLGIRGTRFTLNGKPTFLFGASYFGGLGAPEAAIKQDLERMRALGFNWIRVWATWAAFGHDVSAVDRQGRARPQYLRKLRWLAAECNRRGLVLDVTLSRGNGVTGRPRLQSRRAHRRAVEVITRALRPYRNWYLDLANERNVHDQRWTSLAGLKELRRAVKELDPQRLVTASHAGDLRRVELRDYLRAAGLDFLAVHRPRHSRSPGQTEAKSRQYRCWMRELGRPVPLLYQEPFRRGFGGWQPVAADYLKDARGARAGGAAGWCFHNGDQRTKPDGRPRHCFDLRAKCLFAQLDGEEQEALRKLVALFAPASPRGQKAGK
jgi:hypothetical protein